jgi:energy-coupling factor transporter transmembrane protein EcfT
MDLRSVDVSATRATSALHRIAPVAKLVAFGLVLSSVVVSTNLLVVAAVALVLLGTALGSRLPMRPVLTLAAYPGLFAALFALAAAADPLAGALVVAKAVTAALAAVVLMFTTPYPQVFAPLQRVLPPVIGDALLMTYRSLFLLLDRAGHALTAARLRAGIVGASPVRSAKAVTRSLGGVLLYSIDLSQRTYDVMHLRGYGGRLVVSAQRTSSPAADAVLVSSAALVAGTAAFWRLAGASLAPFAWLPLAAGAIVCVAGLAVRVARREASR